MDSYFQVRDAERTAWFTSQEVRNIADVAAMVTKALDAAGGEGETSVQALADHGGVSLRPISADRFSAQVRDLFCEPPGKLLAELDLKDDTFYCASWVPREEHCVAVSGMISRLLGVYELAMVCQRWGAFLVGFGEWLFPRGCGIVCSAAGDCGKITTQEEIT